MKYVSTLILALGLLVSTAGQVIAEDAEAGVQSPNNRMANIASIVKDGRSAQGQGNKKRVEPQSTGSIALRMIQGLGLVAGLFLIGAHCYKKYALKDAPQTTRKIKIIERSSMGGKQALVLAEVEGQKVLIGLGGDSLSLIKLDTPEIKLEQAVTEGAEDLWFALQKSAASS
jgi:flagellar biogenesis protein FliO